MGLSDRERISMIRSAVLVQYTRVTDRQTDGRTDGRTDGIGVAYTRYSIYAVARKNCKLAYCAVISSSWVSWATDPFPSLIPCLRRQPVKQGTRSLVRNGHKSDRSLSLVSLTSNRAPNCHPKITSAPSLSVFGKRLRTYRFRRSYPDLLI